jgi:hypothetical protein
VNGCTVQITLNSNGTVSTLSGGPTTDGSEDTLVGVINKTGVTLNSIAITGNGIFALVGSFTQNEGVHVRLSQ